MKKEVKIIIAVIAVIAILYILFGRGYSKNVQKVRSWQNMILADYKVNLGEVMDYALKGSKWKDIKYEGEKAVELTGTFKKDNKKLKVIFYVDEDKHTDMYAYYEKDGVKGLAPDIAFDATNYAKEASKALGRTK